MGHARTRTGLAVAIAGLVAAAAGAAPAVAKDSIYWTDSYGGKVNVAAMDGSGAQTLSLAGAPVTGPYGVSIDPTRGKVYWSNPGGNGPSNTIGYANLDGSGGGGQVNTSGVTVNSPYGLSVDPVAGRLYWAGLGDQVSYARLDGSGASVLPTTGASSGVTAGVAADPADGRLYFSGHINNKISFARLDGSGGGDVTEVNYAPNDIALDRATNRLYYAKLGTPKLGWVTPGGGSAGTVNTTGAVVSDPIGVAIDSASKRIYWTNSATQGGPAITPATTIGYANLDGSGGGNLSVAGTNPTTSVRLAILRQPVATAAPAIAGEAKTGSLLSCSRGGWAADSPEAHAYRSPASYAYRWTRNGVAVGTDSALLSATAPGVYACVVTATNASGSTMQTAQLNVPQLNVTGQFGAKTAMRVGLGDKAITTSQPLVITVVNDNAFPVTGSVASQTTGKVQASVAAKRKHKHKAKVKPKVVKLKTKRFTVKARSRTKVKVSLPRSLRKLLAKKKKLSLRVTVKVKDPTGQTRTIRATVKPKLQKPKPKKKKKKKTGKRR